MGRIQQVLVKYTSKFFSRIYKKLFKRYHHKMTELEILATEETKNWLFQYQMPKRNEKPKKQRRVKRRPKSQRRVKRRLQRNLEKLENQRSPKSQRNPKR